MHAAFLTFLDPYSLQRNPLCFRQTPFHDGRSRAIPLVVLGFQLALLVSAEKLDAGEALNPILSYTASPDDSTTCGLYRSELNVLQTLLRCHLLVQLQRADLAYFCSADRLTCQALVLVGINSSYM